MSEPADPAPKPAAPAQVGLPAERPAADAGAAVPATGTPLTPEEQMKRFADELKENDWGHQPC